MALLSTGSHDRETLVASTTYTRTITINSGSNRRLFVAHVGQRFYIDTQTAITFNGVAGTLVTSTSSGPATRCHMWVWTDPTTGSGTLEVTNNTNRNDGAWYWAEYDDVSGTVTSNVDESASDTNANPSVTVGASDEAFMVCGALIASTGGTTPFATIGGTNGITVTGSAPNRTYSSNTQLSAITVVIPQTGGYTLTLDPSSYSISGQAVGTVASRLIGLDSSSYSWSGQNVTLTYTQPGNTTITLDPGSYTLTGSNVLRAIGFSLNSGTYTISGQDVTFNRTFPAAYSIALDSAAYSWAGRSVTLRYSNAPVVGSTQTTLSVGIRMGL